MPMPERQDSTGNGTKMLMLSVFPMGGWSPGAAGWNSHKPGLIEQKVRHSMLAVQILPRIANKLRAGMLRKNVVDIETCTPL
jgi:hypothetical protein